MRPAAGPTAAATGRAAAPATGRAPLVLMLLVAALSLPWLGLAPLFDVDEGAFSEATREMFASGDFLSTTLNGAPRFDKPILIYWLQAAAVAAFGLNEWALRLPSALATLGWCFAVWSFAAPRLGTEGARLATWIGATSLGVLVVGRAATADALLNAILAAAMFDAWRHFEQAGNDPAPGVRPAPAGVDAPRARRPFWQVPLLRLYLWIGLGVLTKGPIAVLIPVAVTFLWAASFRQWRAWFGALASPAGWAIALAVAVPWYAYALAVHGQAFIDGFIMKHNVERFSGTLEGHSGSALYYVVAVPLLVLPWTALLARAVRRLPEDLRGRMTRFLWIWFAFVVVFFSASGTKLPHYALYGVTPLFVLLALHRPTDAGGRLRTEAAAWITVVLLTVLLAAVPMLPWLLVHVGAGLTDPRAGYHAALFGRAMEAAGPLFQAVAWGTLAAWLLLLAIARSAGTRTLAAGAGLLALAVVAGIAPWAGEVLAGPVKRAAAVAVREGGPVVQWNYYAPSFSVYRRQITPSRAPQPGELALTRVDRLPAGDPSLQELFREGGVVLVRKR